LFLKSLHPIRRIKELAQELRRAREQRDQALQDKQRVERENARLREEIERLQKELEAAQRAARGPASGGSVFARPAQESSEIPRPQTGRQLWNASPSARPGACG